MGVAGTSIFGKEVTAMRRPRIARYAALAALVSVSLTAARADEPGDPRADVALTVYSSADPASFDPREAAGEGQSPFQRRAQLPGYGVVRETRSVELEKGENALRFTGVAAGIDPTTVSFKSLTAPDATTVLEQDYEFDLVGADKVLEKYLGREITVRPKGQPEVVATLLAAEPGMLVLQEPANGSGGGGNPPGQGQGIRLIARGQDLTEIALPKLPAGLITRPTLVWKVATEKAGKHDVRVSYQTDGLTWRADYNLVVAKDASKADLGAWVSLLNESGATYPNARLKLVAGDVQRVQPPRPMFRRGVAVAPMAAAAAPAFEEKAFFEYHLYTLTRPTTLADRSTKQIELFPAREGVPVERSYVYDGRPDHVRTFNAPSPNVDRNFGAQSNTKVDVFLSVKNTEENRLGLPLPAGRVRVYQRDEADAALEFVGEDTISHTPKGEKVKVRLGSAFDVVGERKQTSFQANTNARTIIESFSVTVRNHKTEPVRVVIKETLFRWATWTITQQSDPFEKQDARTIHFTVDLPPDGSKTVNYTVRYTW
jgi:hypothetical protein